MRSLEHYAPVFLPGGLDGRGATRLLGSPGVDPTALLVRETAQNSWDARDPGREGVRFTIHVRTLAPEQQSLLRDVILPGDPPGLSRPGNTTGFRRTLEDDALNVIEIHDRGSIGLAGPVRSDLTPPMGSRTDFMDLVLKVGTSKDRHLSGGTYGFGKTVSYMLSRIGTVVFHTHTTHPGEAPAERLMGSAIGDPFDLDGFAHTGRHWWGRMEGDTISPVLGKEADHAAAILMTEIPTADDPGTSLLIVAPDLGGLPNGQWAEKAAASVLWNLWPKMLPDVNDGRSRMSIRVLCDGAEVPIPSPKGHPALQGHARALQAVRAVQDGRSTPDEERASNMVHVDEVTRYSEVIGHLAFTITPYGGTAPAHAEVSGFTGPSHHVALMRHEAELVVEYSEMPGLESPDLQWHAVFKPVASTDHAFAAAEPPAHNRWEVPDSRTGDGEDDTASRTDASRVRVALRRISRLIREHIAHDAGVDPGSTGQANGLARSLSALVIPVSDDPKPGQRERRARRRPPVAEMTARQLRVLADGWVSREIALDLPVIDAPTDLQVAIHVGYEEEQSGKRPPAGWCSSTTVVARPRSALSSICRPVQPSDGPCALSTPATSRSTSLSPLAGLHREPRPPDAASDRAGPAGRLGTVEGRCRPAAHHHGQMASEVRLDAHPVGSRAAVRRDRPPPRY